MMKFVMMLIFMNFMVILNNMVMFYYNLSYLISLSLIFMFMNKDVDWFNIMLGVLGCNYYSMILMILSIWIISLMFMCLSDKDNNNKMKLVIFINMMLLMLMFFMFMDLILFYLSFEISLIPTFFLIVYWGANPERLSAAYYMMIYMLFISFPLLVYIFDIYMFSFTLKFILLMKIVNMYEFTFVSFMMVFMSFFIKMPIYMFHVWLPKAHVEAPVYGSMILAGVLLKMGSYGVIRLLELFYGVVVKYGCFIFSVSIIGSLMVGILCLVQIDMKSMVAYSSVVHMNLMLCSLMTLSKVGMLGSYVMMISHGLCSSGMFYMVNMYYLRSGSRLLILNKGLIGSVPTVMMWWFFFCIINFSFPFSLNFMGEIMMLMVILNWEFMSVLYLMFICFFSAAYSLYLFSYIYSGKNFYYEGKIYSSEMKEYMILIMHFLPLMMLLFNLILFM